MNHFFIQLYKLIIQSTYGIYLLICICIILIPFDLSDKIDNNFVTIIINDIISFVKILVFFVLINIGLLSFITYYKKS